MLPETFQERYDLLKQKLTQLSTSLDAGEIAGGELSAEIARLQSFFNQQVLSLPFSQLTATDFARTKSYNTELHKQLRLLATDAMFLGSAKQAVTVERRKGQLHDRLATLVRYCDVVLNSSPE
ncbi:heterocyst frequency control protein PatD [Oscillatoriales cyanobacterium LEGE 11467]|uniref:Heterocyst frequency control protein PatD n=1 Tax=Zarconia navalis LEGE 11467 TaxID=1828826 RepID=A0A928VX68_9CYAN|nr:heterocyst frequency control protein PatD [Zarconia navalis]MBE9039315.1 heterocyst frequency control protein PatD [Zarconia navalis LEGE 11467]